jgi:hypothetical protein
VLVNTRSVGVVEDDRNVRAVDPMVKQSTERLLGVMRATRA